jgi:hypothetical protein
MRKAALAFLSSALLLGSISFAAAQGDSYQIGREQNMGAYIDLSIENLDAPGQPITVGQRFRVRANCVIDPKMFLNRKIDFEGWGRDFIPITLNNLPSQWTAWCSFTVYQNPDSRDYLFQQDIIEGLQSYSQDSTSFPIVDVVIRAESTAQIYTSGGAEMFGTVIYKDSSGKARKGELDSYPSFEDVPLFSPLAKKKTNSTPSII